VRATIWLAVVVIVSAVVAGLVCRFVGPASHLPQMLVAAVLSLVAAEAAVLPVLLGRGLPPALNAQAGLVATVLHLFICIVGGFVAALIIGPVNRAALLLWMLPFYWITLSALIVIIIRAIRAAPQSTAQNSAPVSS
jgi:hypothetical protein